MKLRVCLECGKNYREKHDLEDEDRLYHHEMCYDCWMEKNGYGGLNLKTKYPKKQIAVEDDFDEVL
jgi:hypothetical protein